MMDDEEGTDSIIPEFVLNAAQSGAAVPTIVKKRRTKKTATVEPNAAIEESPEDGEKKKRSQPKVKKPSSKQTSLTSFLTAPPSGSRWKPVHKQAPANKKKVEVVKKKISIDPQETPRPARVASVVTEVLSGDEDRSGTETKRLANSIARAKRRSIKQYFVKDSAVDKKDKKERPLKNSTPRRKKEASQTSQQEDQSDANQDAGEPASRGSPEVILLDPVSPVEDELDDIEVLMEVETPAAIRGTKRTRSSAPRSLQRLRHSASLESAMDHFAVHPRGAFTTPRRKILRNRSYSPLNFVFDEDEPDVPSTPVVRRRRPDGESSIFDLDPSDADQGLNQHLSTPSTSRGPATANVSFSEKTTVTVVDEGQSDGSDEIGTSPPQIATAVAEEECVVVATQQSGTSGSQTDARSGEVRNSPAGAPCDNEKPSSSHSLVLPSHESSLRGNSVGDGSALRTPPSGNGSARSDGTPSGLRSVSTLLYSPRRMAQTNEERLRTILSKNNNNYEIGPNLDRLMAETDYCGFQVSTLSEDAPPQPHPRQCVDTDLNFGNPGKFVRLPWSTANILNGFHQCVEDVEKKYVIIDRALRSLVEDGAHCIEAVIVTLKECAPWIDSFDGLLGYMDGLSSAEEREALDVMAGIAKLAVNAKFAITSPIPLLPNSKRGSVTLSQEQCACLLAHAFFCTYRREKLRRFNAINMVGLFRKGNPLAHIKLRFILHYFSMVLKKMPTGCVSFWRESLQKEALPNWEHEEKSLPLLGVASNSSIEDSSGCLQVDFANEYIGGGVLCKGAVQEEIRFLICPEMIVSCLLCEKMDPLEVIRIVGAQRYSSYFGYGETLEWAPYEDFGTEPRDEFRRVKCELVAMDATLFKYSFKNTQYSKENIDRELNKAYIGFMSRYPVASPVATGNWGCGVFGGDKELKSLIQMIAAARAGRDMIYYTFANPQFQKSMVEQYEKLVQKKASIGTLYKALISYAKERERNPRLTVYEHVYAFVSEIACTTS